MEGGLVSVSVHAYIDRHRGRETCRQTYTNTKIYRIYITHTYTYTYTHLVEALAEGRVADGGVVQGREHLHAVVQHSFIINFVVWVWCRACVCKREINTEKGTVFEGCKTHPAQN